ncbi:MAG: hypothetical protein AB1642_00025 [Pseudomonadota bacterium]
MTTVPENLAMSSHSSDNAINLWDLLEFLTRRIKALFLSGVIGALLGLSGWYAFAPYKTELVIDVDKTISGIDYVSWRSLQSRLPALASRLANQPHTADDGLRNLYRSLSSSGWWPKHIKPTYALTKNDTKDLAGIDANAQVAAGTILNLVISMEGTSELPPKFRLPVVGV